jgi:hypothetical protein
MLCITITRKRNAEQQSQKVAENGYTQKRLHVVATHNSGMLLCATTKVTHTVIQSAALQQLLDVLFLY